MELTNVGNGIYNFGSTVITGGYHYSFEFGSALCNKVIAVAQAILASEAYTALSGLFATALILHMFVRFVKGFHNAYYPTATRTNQAASYPLITN